MGKWKGTWLMKFPDFDEAERTISQQRHYLTHHLWHCSNVAILLELLRSGGLISKTSHQHLKPEMQKARRPKCWHWIKPLSSSATAFWEERCPKLSVYIWLWPSNGSCTETSLRLRLSCSERASSYKISSEFHEKSSGFLQVPHLALNLLLRVKDTAVSLFIFFLFITLASRLWLSGIHFPLWQPLLIYLSERSLLSDTFAFWKIWCSVIEEAM